MAEVVQTTVPLNLKDILFRGLSCSAGVPEVKQEGGKLLPIHPMRSAELRVKYTTLQRTRMDLRAAETPALGDGLLWGKGQGDPPFFQHTPLFIFSCTPKTTTM